MKLIACVHFHGEGAAVAAVAFEDWDAREASQTFTFRVAELEKPERGKPDLRELQCILQLLQEHRLKPEVILIDAPVHLDAAEAPGPGWRLFDALGGQSAVIGISTKAMPGMPAQFEVFREEEARPMIVTCAGIDLGAAKVRVRNMHGKKRIPTLVKLAARMARENPG
ncbi:endonuclease V [Azohydromonas aeria]|uniref:endonuclease V n=1 Tax=Azohydromonas aeria TaxID=2590212 RepID=UPI0012FB64D5|nr:endonuclease V [Azohydromonas aeria]